MCNKKYCKITKVHFTFKYPINKCLQLFLSFSLLKPGAMLKKQCCKTHKPTNAKTCKSIDSTLDTTPKLSLARKLQSERNRFKFKV